MAIALSDIATAKLYSGNYGAFEANYRDALRMAHVISHAEVVAMLTGNLAGLAIVRENWRAAETLARAALPLSEAIHRQELIGHDNHCLADALLRPGKAVEILFYAQDAVEIFARLGDSRLAGVQAILAECGG